MPGSGPGAHDEQGSENPAHGGTSAITHTAEAQGSSHTHELGGAGQQSHTAGRRGAQSHAERGARGQQSHLSWGAGQQSHTRAGRRRGSSHTRGGRRGQQSHTSARGARGQQSHTARGGAGQQSHTSGGRGAAVTHMTGRCRAGCVGGGRLRPLWGLRDPCSGSTARPSNKVSPQVTVLSFTTRRSWIRDSARSSCVLSCSKLSVWPEKKPQCVSGPHYLGRTLRAGPFSISLPYRPGSFQRARCHKPPTRRLRTAGAGAPATPPSCGVPPNSSLQACALQ